MTAAILIAIGVMFIPVAMLNLGKGEPKTTGGMVLVAGIITVAGAFLQGAVYKDVFTAALLFAFGILYLTIAHALLAEISDWRSVGQCSFVVAIVCAMYSFLFLIGTATIAQSYYLSFMNAAFTILTIQVGFLGYGKISGKSVAWSLILITAVCLFLPAFDLMAYGKLPF